MNRHWLNPCSSLVLGENLILAQPQLWLILGLHVGGLVYSRASKIHSLVWLMVIFKMNILKSTITVSLIFVAFMVKASYCTHQSGAVAFSHHVQYNS